MHTRGTLVFLADFLDETTGHKILQLFVSTKTKHFFATAHRVANLEIGENALEKVVETEDLLFRKDVAKLIRDMVGKPTRESGTFRGNCHNEATIHASATKATQKKGFHPSTA